MMSPNAARRNVPSRERDRQFGRSGGGLGEAQRKLGPSCYVEVARAGNTVRLVLIGELDISCSRRFREILDEAAADQPEELVIDLRSLTFVDSTGLALLLKANALARRHEIRIQIVRSGAEIVKAVFEAAGVDRLLPFCDEVPSL
jgi:anti-sigma B factor antagonist